VTELTVIIATFNRAQALRRCLDALERQTAALEAFDVVVVDDGSTDDTGEMLAAYNPPYRLRVERQPNRGPAAARNAGIRIASGAYCLFMDDDIVADPGLVEEHLRAQRDHTGVIGLGQLGLQLTAAPGGLTCYFADWWAEHYRRFAAGEREPDFWACYSGNLSAPTVALRNCGGFQEGLARSEDVELAYRLVRAGLEIVYLPRAGAEQVYTKGFADIVHDFDQAGAAAVALWRRHPELASYAPLGDFAQGGTRTLLLRRLLLAVRAPLWPLRLVDPLLAHRAPDRLYRFVQLYCFWRGLRRSLPDRDTWRRLTRGTVILMYHAIGGSGERASRYVLPSGRFRRQLAWLRLRRRPVLSLDEYVRHREENRLPPPGSVVLTFDDGYADTLELAVPMLVRSGISAAIFVTTGAVGAVNEWDASGTLAGRSLMEWDGIRRAHAAGMTVGAHSVTHPRLTEVAEEVAQDEIENSRARLEEELGAPARHFAYPYGKTSRALQERLGRAGFASGCGIEPGPNGPAISIHDLRRMEVMGTTSILRFAADLWLGRPVRSPRAHQPAPRSRGAATRRRR
jgi:peptidoglycan/xylan/chitin deacetylase (PgdA/CDA1 family)